MRERLLIYIYIYICVYVCIYIYNIIYIWTGTRTAVAASGRRGSKGIESFQTGSSHGFRIHVYYIILYYIILYYNILYYIILCYIILYMYIYVDMHIRICSMYTQYVYINTDGAAVPETTVLQLIMRSSYV